MPRPSSACHPTDPKPLCQWQPRQTLTRRPEPRHQAQGLRNPPRHCVAAWLRRTGSTRAGCAEVGEMALVHSENSAWNANLGGDSRAPRFKLVSRSCSAVRDFDPPKWDNFSNGSLIAEGASRASFEESEPNLGLGHKGHATSKNSPDLDELGPISFISTTRNMQCHCCHHVQSSKVFKPKSFFLPHHKTRMVQLWL